MIRWPKKGISPFKSFFVFMTLLIFLLFYEDRNYISWKETFRGITRLWRTPFLLRLTSCYPEVLNTSFNETENHISVAKVEKIRRKLLKKGEKTVWIKYPQDSSLYTQPLKLNIYQRIAEILYPVKIDPLAKYEIIVEAGEKGEFLLKLIEIKKSQERRKAQAKK